MALYFSITRSNLNTVRIKYLYIYIKIIIMLCFGVPVVQGAKIESLSWILPKSMKEHLLSRSVAFTL